MQEEEKEALKAEIYYQIMEELAEQENNAELFYQIMKNHEKQSKPKKLKVLLGVFISLWVVILAPFILFIAENIYTSQKWPVIIKMPIQPNSTVYLLFQLFVGVLVVIIFARMVWSLVNPLRCQCGYFTWPAHSMLTHIEMKHQTRDDKRTRARGDRLCSSGKDLHRREAKKQVSGSMPSNEPKRFWRWQRARR